MKRITYITIISIMLTSCASQISGVKRNFKKTDKLAEKLFQKNGNSFAVTSTYSNFSQVWTYNKKQRVKYDLIKGKIKQVDTTKSNFYNDHLIQAQSSFDGMNPLACSELDGGLFLIRMQYNSDYKNIDYYSVNIQCIFNEKNKEGFLKALANDVDFLNYVFKRN